MLWVNSCRVVDIIDTRRPKSGKVNLRDQLAPAAISTSVNTEYNGIDAKTILLKFPFFTLFIWTHSSPGVRTVSSGKDQRRDTVCTPREE